MKQLAVGASLGVTFHSISAGIGLGLALGLAAGLLLGRLTEGRRQ